jgi:hypothetical protein
LVASIVVGLSAIFGVAATTKTVGIGESKPATSQVSDQTIAAQNRKLNRAEAALRKAKAQKPPALPAVPPAPQPRLVAQPAPPAAPIVRSAAPSSSDDEHDDEGDDD